MIENNEIKIKDLPLFNVVLTTKGLRDRNILLLDGTMVENKSKRG